MSDMTAAEAVHVTDQLDAFAHLPGARIGEPRWWVDQIVSCVGVVADHGAGAAGSLSVVRRNAGGPTNRTADGSNPSAA